VPDKHLVPQLRTITLMGIFNPWLLQSHRLTALYIRSTSEHPITFAALVDVLQPMIELEVLSIYYDLRFTTDPTCYQYEAPPIHLPKLRILELNDLLSAGMLLDGMQSVPGARLIFNGTTMDDSFGILNSNNIKDLMRSI
jgi:hypothetical protein